mgnify:CR=1 FL=1
MVCPGQDRDYRYDHRCTLTDDQTCHRKADGWLHAMLSEMIIDQIDGTHTENLFRQLRHGRNGSLAYAVEIAVDAGVYGCHGNGEGNDAQKGRGPALHQESYGDSIGA